MLSAEAILVTLSTCYVCCEPRSIVLTCLPASHVFRNGGVASANALLIPRRSRLVSDVSTIVRAVLRGVVFRVMGGTNSGSVLRLVLCSPVCIVLLRLVLEELVELAALVLVVLIRTRLFGRKLLLVAVTSALEL